MRPVDDPTVSTAERYRVFATIEAPGQSASYEALALGVADDTEVIALIDELPVAKRQVNLVFAAARAAGVPVDSYPAFREAFIERWGTVRSIALDRSTQTNEAGRCAVLLPILAALPQPLALIEVGASAGLCLYPDRYSYRFGSTELHPTSGPSAVLLEPVLHGPVPIPERLPDIVWRAGLDINPLDVFDETDVQWLETLVWPEHTERRDRLRAAVEIARAERPRIVKADAVEGLASLAEEAPDDATLVVFHSAVLAYFSTDERTRFVDAVSALDCEWISNEGIQILPGVQKKLGSLVPEPSLFVVAHNGEPVGFAGGHGQSLSWIG